MWKRVIETFLISATVLLDNNVVAQFRYSEVLRFAEEENQKTMGGIKDIRKHYSV